MPLVKEDTIGDLAVEIHVNARTGAFSVKSASDGESLGHADTMDRAIAQARQKASQRKVRVSIPFLTKSGEPGEATGIHAKTRSTLVRINGEAHQLDGREARGVFRADMPPEKLARFMELDQEIRERQRESREIETEYTFDLASQVQREVVAKAQEAP